MNPIRINLEQLKNKTIPIGREGENEYTVVRIDCGKVFREHPQAEVSMRVKPPKGIIYPAVVERDGNEIIWTVKDYDLASKGDGQFQLTFTDGTVICKTAIGRTLVLKSLVGDGPAPTPIEDWMEEAQEALDSLEDAEVNQPMIGEDGYWYTWNQEAGEYQKTETKAEGQDGDPGFSPSASVSKSGKTTTITITDQSGTTTAQVLDGSGVEIDDTVPAADKVFSSAKVDEELGGVKNALTSMTVEEKLLRSELPGTTVTVTFGSDDNPSSITHSANGTTIRTDVFTWGTGSVEEVRTLSTGEQITIITNLETLAQTISEVEVA